MLSNMDREYTADELRRALIRYSFVPLIRGETVGEIWGRGARRVTVFWPWDNLAAVVTDLRGAYAIDRGDFIELSFE